MAVEAPCKRVFEPEEGWVRLTLLSEDDIYIDSIVTQDEAYLALHERLQYLIRHACYPSLVYYPERPDVLFGRATQSWIRSDTPRAELLEE